MQPEGQMKHTTDETQRLTALIVDMEWEFFDAVQNIGGRAVCQDDPRTFRIMRESQLHAWNKETLKSYLTDLLRAKNEGRNPLAEKYGYMMAYTSPAEYASLKGGLPPVPARKRKLIDELVSIQVTWQKTLADTYPKLTGQGRPLRSAEDTPDDTSFETYLRGELATYSEQTLRQFLSYCKALKKQNRNLCRNILEYTVRQYGYVSLEQAENGIF